MRFEKKDGLVVKMSKEKTQKDLNYFFSRQRAKQKEKGELFERRFKIILGLTCVFQS